MLRGPGKKEAQNYLRACEKRGQGSSIASGWQLVFAGGFFLGGRGYKHLGAMASAALRFSLEVAARVNAAHAIEKSLTKSICS